MKVAVGPVTRAEARAAVREWHSHHKPHLGEKFALGGFIEDRLVAVAVWSRPVGPELAKTRFVWEMTRLVVGPDAPRFTASRPIGAATKVALAAGLRRLVSYTRIDERGSCYRAAGWHPTARVHGREHTTGNRSTRWLPGLYEPSSEVVDRIRWERGPDAAPARWDLLGSADEGKG